MTDRTKRIPLGENSPGRGLVLTSLGLLCLGVVMVHSAVASVASPGAWFARVDVRHTVFAALALLVLVAIWRVDYHRLGGERPATVPAAILLLALVCGLLVFVPGLGKAVGGYHRWIRLGPAKYAIGFQPSELIKIALVVFLAAWLSRKGRDIRSFRRTFLPAVAVTGLCLGLVITQDFGTAAIIGVAAAATMLLAGVPWFYLLTLLGPAAGGFYLLVVCDPRRWGRITAMFDVWSPGNPTAYQPRQSLLAVLSGGWFGKGLGGGMQKLGFLPEDSTDFIFSVFCEEWGFIGAVLLLGLVVMWLWQVRRIVASAGDPLGRLLAGSLGFLIGLQAVLHIAVDLGAAPPTGIGLPFVSAGGTALVMTAEAAGMIVSVSAHRPYEPQSP